MKKEQSPLALSTPLQTATVKNPYKTSVSRVSSSPSPESVFKLNVSYDSGSDISYCSPPSGPSLTQAAFIDVKKEVAQLKKNLVPKHSVRHEEILQLGREVRSFSSQVKDLNCRLHDSHRIIERLKSRLRYYENEEEHEMIQESIAYNEDKDNASQFGKYGPKYSRNFNSYNNRR